MFEVAINRDGGAEQLFPLMAIARRMLLTLGAFSARRCAGKAGKAFEIAEIAQCAMQFLFDRFASSVLVRHRKQRNTGAAQRLVRCS
jgi:hypothetical protein